MANPTNDPRRTEVATTLQAKPQVQPPDPKALTELGVTNVTGGIPDVVPQWRTGRQSLRIIEQMINNDATVNSSLLAVKTPVIGGEYYMEPATGQQVDVDAAEYCKHNLFERMSVDWLRSSMKSRQSLSTEVRRLRRCGSRAFGHLSVRQQTAKST